MHLATIKSDRAAWARGQARLIRTGKLHHLDLINLADELDDLAEIERQELANHLSKLVSLLLQYQAKPDDWLRMSVGAQRSIVSLRLSFSPSLLTFFDDAQALDQVWTKAMIDATKEMGGTNFPAKCPWSIKKDVMRQHWLPKAEPHV